MFPMFPGFCRKLTLKEFKGNVGGSYVLCCCFCVISIPFLNIIVGLLVFVNVIQIFNRTDFEIKCQTLTLVVEPVELHVFFYSSIYS